MLNANKPIHTLNLTNNKLRDDFALAAISNLKQNKRMSKLLLYENVIDLKHIRTIEKMLQSNKITARKSVLPVFQRQLDRLKLNPHEWFITQKKISDIDLECKQEKAIMKQNADALKKTQKKQESISAKVNERKAKVC